MALVCYTVHEAHLPAAAAITAHKGVEHVTALVHVQGGSIVAPTVATLLHALHRSKTTLAVRKPLSRACFGPRIGPRSRQTRKWWTLIPLGHVHQLV